MMTAYLPLGQIVIQAEAFRKLVSEDILRALEKHSRGIWGDNDQAQRHSNDKALLEGKQVVSRFSDANGVGFLITTRGDHTRTIVSLST